DNSREVRPLLKRRINALSELQLLFRRDVAARNIRKLLGLDLRVFPDLRDGSYDLIDRLPAVVPTECSRFALLPGNRATRRYDQDARQIRLTTDERCCRNIKENEVEGQPGNLRFCQHRSTMESGICTVSMGKF